MGITRLLREFRNQSKAKKDFRRDIQRYVSLQKGDSFEYNARNNIPIFYDKYKEAGKLDSHYFLQDIYISKRIIGSNVKQHFDVGSRVDGFISHLLAAGTLEKVTMLDIRPLSVVVDGLDFVKADATNLDTIEDNSIYSLSSLHAIEHFGLGRYGDEIDPRAWQKALLSMQRKMAPGGVLYLSVPIGIEEKLCFNAHRIFAPQTIVTTLDELKLLSFAYIHDYKIIESTPEFFMKNGGTYDCGLFVFEKPYNN